MNYASPASVSSEKLLPLAGSQRPLERSLLTRLEAFRDRLDNFTVVDAQGETVGEIRNVVLYKRRLHLVIVQPDVHHHWRFMLLSSPLVQQVRLRDRAIVVHTTHADISYLPEQRSLTNCANRSHASVLAPVSQLPASPTQDKVKSSSVVGYAETPKVFTAMVNASRARSHDRSKESNEKRHAFSYPVTTPVPPVPVRVSERMS